MAPIMTAMSVFKARLLDTSLQTRCSAGDRPPPRAALAARFQALRDLPRCRLEARLTSLPGRLLVGAVCHGDDLPVQDDGRITPGAVAQGCEEAAKRGDVNELDSQALAILPGQLADPVTHTRVLGAHVGRQGRRPLLGPKCLPQPEVMEGDLAVRA